ncbi:MAG: hypothetical protein FWD75_04405 [Propionibacteriaceae bacterium]|nr:hypothetical protein [Propionibacteriaceae bacterium]
MKRLSITLLSLIVVSMSMTPYAQADDSPTDGSNLPQYSEQEVELYKQVYRDDQKLIAAINANMDSLVTEGKLVISIPEKEDVTPHRGSMGSWGDILVSLITDSGSVAFAGHAAIVSMDNHITVESFAESFSPIGLDGVQYYTNSWNKSGALLVRPYDATATMYTTAATFAQDKVGLPYNWNFFNKSTTSKYYCSQLVWQAWLAAGIDTEAGSIPNGVIAPADLVNSSNTYIAKKID